jgi:hypothetical protein
MLNARTAWLGLGALALCLALPPGARAGADVAPRQTVPPVGAAYVPAAADLAMLGALAGAREGLSLLVEAQTKQQRDIAYATAIDNLTALYQLHGLAWAKEKLDWLYVQPDCPALLTGYSADGRFYLRLQTLELRNPAFADYTVLLCQLASNSAQDLSVGEPRLLALELANGTCLPAEELNPLHPLWSKLSAVGGTFQVLSEVPSGFTPSFKQIFRVPGLSINGLAAVRFAWGPYTVTIDHRLAADGESTAQSNLAVEGNHV